MRQSFEPVRRAFLLCALLALSACTFSDSLLNAPVASVWPSSRAIRPPVVVFATDREPWPEEAGDFIYGPHWGDELSCGSAALTLTTGWPQFGLPLPSKDKPPIRDVTCQGDMGGFAAALAASGRAGCTRALLFVHGYNTTFRTALLRAGQIAADTQWPCAVGVFSWSSEGKFDRYAADIERSGYAVPELVTVLRAVAGHGLKLSIVAHSMGTRVTLSALGALSRSCRQTGEPVVDELILAAADISAEHDNDDFLHLLTNAMPCAAHVTVYASNYDMVLIASESIHGGIPRAGRVPKKDLQYPACDALKADIVDASYAPGDKLGHGYFVLSYEMLRDIMWTLARKTMQDRAGKAQPGGPTLVPRPKIAVDCGEGHTPRTATADRYALLVAEDRRPSAGTRLLRQIIPIVIPVQ